MYVVESTLCQFTCAKIYRIIDIRYKLKIFYYQLIIYSLIYFLQKKRKPQETHTTNHESYERKEVIDLL